MVEKKTVGSIAVKVTIHAVLILLTLSCLVPIVNNLAISFSSKAAAEANLVGLLPVQFTVNAYAKIMEDIAFWRSFVISVTRVLLALFITLSTCVMAAFPMSKSSYEFKPRTKLVVLFLFCMLFSGGTVPWYLVMKSYGFVNSIFGLAVCGGFPIGNMILLMNFFRNSSKELQEAAMIDGAGPWRILLRIVVPLSKPVIATISLFIIVGQWNEFFNGLVLSTSVEHYPLQTYIRQFVAVQDLMSLTAEQLREAMTMSNKTLDSAKIFISMVPLLCIYPFLQRYFVTGLTIGSVKE